jgi:hypothetical protein
VSDALIGPRRGYKGSALERYHQQQREMEECDPPPMASFGQRMAMHRARLRADADRKAAQVRFHEANRRAAQLQRTPPWADMEAIRAVYARAREISVATGVEHHVDHEIPLQGRLVSGLHVPNNLQVITGLENIKKRNRFEVSA